MFFFFSKEPDPQARTENQESKFYIIDKKFLKPIFLRAKFEYAPAHDNIELTPVKPTPQSEVPSTIPLEVPQPTKKEEKETTHQVQLEE